MTTQQAPSGPNSGFDKVGTNPVPSFRIEGGWIGGIVRRALRSLSIAVVRPYVRRELPGYGRVYENLVGRRAWIWHDAPVRQAKNKRTNFTMRLDLSKWPERVAYFTGRWYSLDMQLAMDSLIKQGDTVVDVGANRGDFSLYASKLVGTSGKVIAFEPNPNIRSIFEKELRLNNVTNVTVNGCGLAEHEAQMMLTVPEWNSGEAYIGTRLGIPSFEVIVRRGDDVLFGESPNLIKIDVEGYETSVIKGLAETISKSEPIIILEVVSQHLGRAGSSVDELTSTMRALGYLGYGLALKRGARRSYGWRLTQFDGSLDHLDAIWLKSSNEHHQHLLMRHYK